MNSKRLILSCTLCVFSLLLVSAIAGCSSPAKEPASAAAPVVTQQQEPANDAPVIASLIADLQVQPLGKTQVVCDAIDANGDNLTYRWTATDGTITGSASTVTWTAPQKAGSYMITVVVNDGKGGVSKKDVIVTVPDKPNNAPVIEGIKFQRPGHLPTTIKPNMTEKEKDKNPDPVIRIYETADITCIASDPDNDKLDYAWMATAGKINSVPGKPESVQWIVPGAGGTYKVTCEVSDPRGLTANFTIVITVKCCGI
jgi:hypothetical protein